MKTIKDDRSCKLDLVDHGEKLFSALQCRPGLRNPRCILFSDLRNGDYVVH